MTTVGEPIEPEVWRWYHDVLQPHEIEEIKAFGGAE